MLPEPAALDVSTRRRATLGYAIGLAVYTLVVVALYPAFKDATDLDQMLSDQPGLSAMFGISGSLTTPDGWLSGNVYANFLPLILLFVTIGHGAATLAGEEERGRLDLVLALPFSRRALLLQKAAAMALTAAVVAGITFLAALVGRAFDVDVVAASLATTTLGALLMALAFGFVALAIGGGTGQRGLAIGVTSAIAAASYLVSSLGPVVDWLAPWRRLSLFYWSIGNGQLTTGLGWTGAIVLVVATAAALIGAIATFERHDVSA
jgi:beta-exotoxin I transport system permease protein